MIHIRPMLQNDIDRVHAIEIKAHIAPWSRKILSDCILVRYDCRVLERVTEQGALILGYMICRPHLNTCHILNLCVAPLEQKKGYGKLLLESLFEFLKKTQIKQVVLEVRPSNVAALKLYKNFGFIKEEIKKDYYNDENGVEDAILLKKDI